MKKLVVLGSTIILLSGAYAQWARMNVASNMPGTEPGRVEATAPSGTLVREGANVSVVCPNNRRCGMDTGKCDKTGETTTAAVMGLGMGGLLLYAFKRKI